MQKLQQKQQQSIEIKIDTTAIATTNKQPKLIQVTTKATHKELWLHFPILSEETTQKGEGVIGRSFGLWSKGFFCFAMRHLMACKVFAILVASWSMAYEKSMLQIAFG